MSVSGFVSRSACRGRRPSHYASCALQSRPTLVAQLLKNRDVVRCIVAPSGYGKSFLALEYAETMKYWAHTFWVNCQSPCFVRDLDEGALATYILEFDPEASLVVFDGLPLLDMERQERFSLVIDALLAEGCEVIATCTPSCDALGALQSDRLLVDAADLLLSDKELDDMRSADERSRKPASQVGAAWRVALLAWSRAENRGELFAKGALAEELPNDLLLAMASVFVLGKGSYSDLESLGVSRGNVLVEMERDYPHFGLDAETERFEGPVVKEKELAAALRPCLFRIVERSSFDSAKRLVGAWAALLLRDGEAPRACSLVQEVYPRIHRGAWVIDNARELVRQACFAPTFRLVASLGDSVGDTRLRLGSLESLCRRLLGDEEGALQCAKRSAFNDSAPQDARVLSLLVLARVNGGMLSQRACDILGDLPPEWDEAPYKQRTIWELLELAWRARMEGMEALTRLWSEYREAQVDDDVLSVCASWVFSLYGRGEREKAGEGLLGCRQVERYVRERLSEKSRQNTVDYYLVSAGLSLEDAHAYGMPFEGGALETPTLIMLRQVEMDALSQRRYFEEDVRLEQVRQSDWRVTHPSTFPSLGASNAADAPERTVPLLTLKMFGCFEVSLGGVPLEYNRFRRQNTRALLVLLAVNQGREVSRDVIAETMWPKSSTSVARKNFYTVWSYLRTALSLPDGTCPFLVRHRYGCSLDSRFVQSDVERFNEICRELQFGSPNVEQWSLLFAEIDRDFSSDLMPAEEGNALITRARNDYRTRLVDALVTATGSVLDASIPQWGVWFARAAVQHDDTREDAYVALMRAQIAGNQRTAAMMTYLKCRRALADKLGIDPSPETTALYESLLDSE